MGVIVDIVEIRTLIIKTLLIITIVKIITIISTIEIIIIVTATLTRIIIK